MQRLNRRLYSEIIAALFILLFTYTATSKLFKSLPFYVSLSSSPLIGEYARFFSWMLPITELAIAALLFFPASRRIGFFSSFALMLLFTVYLAYMITFTENLPCSCGGVLQQMSWKQHLWFNILFSILAGFGIYLTRRKRMNFYPSMTG
ncbi:MAG: MauE/DoxX family redox-associated membrane protein [Chitinophagaceae bacterium]